MLLGLLAPDEGRLLVGDRPIGAEQLDEWRRHLAWAPQHPTLLHDTVAVNIALGRSDADDLQIRAAARGRRSGGVRGRSARRVRHRIGNGGHGLSAGQRQRLGLARALLRPASLLVLDEPTAHLDPVSVASVAATLDERRGTRTVVVMTHDPPRRATTRTRGRARGRSPVDRRSPSMSAVQPGDRGELRALVRLAGSRMALRAGGTLGTCRSWPRPA